MNLSTKQIEQHLNFNWYKSCGVCIKKNISLRSLFALMHLLIERALKILVFNVYCFILFQKDLIRLVVYLSFRIN